MKLPIVHGQIKKIKALWMKSSSPDKDMMIKELDNTLREIEREYMIDSMLSEDLESAYE